MTTITLTRERTDLLEELGERRGFLRFTARDLTEEQARLTPTASVLSIGGLIKHVTVVESVWGDFVRRGPVHDSRTPEEQYAAQLASFRPEESETLAELLAAYEKVAAETDGLVRTVDLDADHALPERPWFEPGARWSNRKAITHIIGETAQHAGHADIIRETIDGQKTMG
ncbi:MAG: DinB family protein [Nocardioides sp.]|nr:DinB family protein [Nocardioides sp.]